MRLGSTQVERYQERQKPAASLVYDINDGHSAPLVELKEKIGRDI